jgi:hypothetical protein
MVKIELKQGLIGFFDILGYQQMLLNNEVEKTAHLIVNVLANTPANILEALMMDTGQEYDERLRTIQIQSDRYREMECPFMACGGSLFFTLAHFYSDNCLIGDCH